MRYDPEKHHRRSIRREGYDYAQSGAYFITICAKDRACLFGEVVDGEMRVNAIGEMVEFTWFDLPNHVDGLLLDAFVVMPNHVHGIVVIDGDVRAVIDGDVRAGSEPAPTAPARTAPARTAPATRKKRHDLPEIVRQFKTFSARRINQYRQTPGIPVWQRHYYEHIICSEESLNRNRQYILENPKRWANDGENPAAILTK